jgi:hypothetical protein
MCYIREASDRRDKVLALLGMASAASDNYSINALSAHCEITEEALLKQVITFILNRLEILITWNNKEIDISKNKGCIPCSQSSVFSEKRWHLGHKQEISITLTTGTRMEGEGAYWPALLDSVDMTS